MTAARPPLDHRRRDPEHAAQAPRRALIVGTGRDRGALAAARALERAGWHVGVGTPDDLVGAVQRGIDMFDCVMPTRAGRTARAYTASGVLNLRNARHADADRPLDPACACPACARHGRAYLHHLFRAGEMLGPMLLTAHNLTYYQSLMRGLRAAILDRRLAEHAAAVRAAWAAGDPA